MPRNLWEDDNSGAAVAVSSGNADAGRKAMFPTITGNLWMSRGEEAWTADSAGTLSGSLM